MITNLRVPILEHAQWMIDMLTFKVVRGSDSSPSYTRGHSLSSPTLLGQRVFSARQHSICLARYMLSPVRLSVTRVDHITRSQAVARIADRTAKNCSDPLT